MIIKLKLDMSKLKMVFVQSILNLIMKNKQRIGELQLIISIYKHISNCNIHLPPPLKKQNKWMDITTQIHG